jgi:hypothetical protein
MAGAGHNDMLIRTMSKPPIGSTGGCKNDDERRSSQMSYEEIRIAQELSESVQRAVGMHPRRHETLGELVKDVKRGMLECPTQTWKRTHRGRL